MKREIYEVHVGYVNENGFHVCDKAVDQTYPKIIDSQNHNNDVDATLQAAQGYMHTMAGTLAPRTERKVQYAYILRVSDGVQIEKVYFGKPSNLDLPDPEPTPEPEPEEESNESVEPEEESEGGEE